MKLTEKPEAFSRVVAAGSLIVLVGAALPWGRSGETDRSSFELVRLARRLEVLDGVAAMAARAWLLVPLAVAIAVVAAFAGRWRVAAALGTALAIAGVALAVAVQRSPLVPRYGLGVTMVGALLLGTAAAGRALPTIIRWRPGAAPPNEGPR